MIDLETKIYSYSLLCFLRFNLPAIDCFILELKHGVNFESSEILANSPATLVYTFANAHNYAIRNLLLSNKDQMTSKGAAGKTVSDDIDIDVKDQSKTSYDMLRRRTIFTFICHIMMKDMSVDTKELYNRIMQMDSTILSCQRNLCTTRTARL